MRKIGLMGLVVNNGNMGCLALTYSMVSMLNHISSDIGEKFEYYIFEYMHDETKYRHMEERLSIGNGTVYWAELRYALKTLKIFRECDVIIDLTEGDSFADIYGNKRFFKNIVFKMMAIISGSSYILGPQTYGPFNGMLNRYLAKYVIDRALYIFARDEESAKYIAKEMNIHRRIVTCTDIAFKLPWHTEKKRSGIVGFNPSKLLFNKEYDPRRIKISIDFKQYSYQLVSILISKGYQVHLIAHVNGDYEINKLLHEKFPETVLVNKFDDPIEVKSYISSLDAIISCRMHACIGGYSAGVNTIPLAYSRKFYLLFNHVGLMNIVSLEQGTTNEAILNTIKILTEKRNVISVNAINEIDRRLASFYQCLDSLLMRDCEKNVGEIHRRHNIKS